MLQTTAAVLAAAASAGLIVAFVSGRKPGTGSQQAAIDRSRSNGSRIGTPPIESISTGITRRVPVDQELQTSNANYQSSCVRSWPYYEPSCLRSNNPGNPRTVRVVVGDGAAAAHAEQARR